MKLLIATFALFYVISQASAGRRDPPPPPAPTNPTPKACGCYWGTCDRHPDGSCIVFQVPSNAWHCWNNFCPVGYQCFNWNGHHGYKMPPRHECALNGQWGSWQAWSKCNRSCGGGRQMRRRNCDSPPPYNGGKECSGPPFEMQDCNVQSCTTAAPAPTTV